MKKQRNYQQYLKEVVKWEEKPVSFQTLSAALREYLELRGYKVNNKRAVSFNHRGAKVFVEKD